MTLGNESILMASLLLQQSNFTNSREIEYPKYHALSLSNSENRLQSPMQESKEVSSFVSNFTLAHIDNEQLRNTDIGGRPSKTRVSLMSMKKKSIKSRDLQS